MKTVREVSDIAGVSIRTLQYYDKIGLLQPSDYTEAGYRLYDDTDIARLQQILLFRELEFPLKDIKRIINSPDYHLQKALSQQITLLELKKEHLEKLINLARNLKKNGGNNMNFTAFDTQKIDEYANQAKASWGHTAEYQAFKEKKQTQGELLMQGQEMMTIFAEFGKIKHQNPTDKPAQILVKKLQDFITEHYYPVSNEILTSLGEMYVSDSEFTKNIDQAGGEGTAEFVNRAIKIFSKQ